MTVLILGGLDDSHAVHVRDELAKRHFDVELFDSRWFPTQMQVGYDPVVGTGTIALPSGRRLEWRQIRSVYWRCYNSVIGAPLPDAEQAFIATNDARSMFESLLIRLPAKWVNSWHAFHLHQTKPVQLAMIAALGVPVPETILGNEPESIKAFAARHPQCIFKPVQGGAHTRRITAAHLTEENLRNLAFAPVTLQEEILGTNIRVFIAGDRVLACDLPTESIDFRDDPDPRIVPHALPPAMVEQCLKIARTLELLWTGIDLRLTPEGRYVFLEANPSPMFMGFEKRSGLPITDALVALLTE